MKILSVCSVVSRKFQLSSLATGQKIKAFAVSVALLLGGGVTMAQEMPTSYVLRGVGTGSLGEISFSQQPFTLAFEGLGEDLTSGNVPYVAGDHPDWSWFNQDPVSRIIFSLPSAGTITVVEDPDNYALLAANFGRYRQIYGGGQTFDPFTTFTVCQSGLGQYDCWGAFGQTFLVDSSLDFRVPTDGRVGLTPDYYTSFDFSTTRGALHLGGLQGTSLQIMTPIPEPETVVLMSMGLMGVWLTRRRANQKGSGDAAIPVLAGA